jgi:hypothetical protein
VIDDVISLTRNNKVGFGGSMTIGQIGIIDHIKETSDCVNYHHTEETWGKERESLASDIFLTSANAISMNGEIVNIDGVGNRVAATCFGPREVLYLIGKNKITKNFAEALMRAKQTAINLAKNGNRNTPCVKTGECGNCLSSDCVCSITSIHRRNPYGTKIMVFLIDEILGL